MTQGDGEPFHVSQFTETSIRKHQNQQSRNNTRYTITMNRFHVKMKLENYWVKEFAKRK